MSKDNKMPPLVAIAGALGSAAVVRWAYRTVKRVNKELDEARQARMAAEPAAPEARTLRRDPGPGAYRPG
jgi:hypothetical protein